MWPLHSYMVMQRESICCNEIVQIFTLLEDDGLAVCPMCVTKHPDFSNVYIYVCAEQS